MVRILSEIQEELEILQEAQEQLVLRPELELPLAIQGLEQFEIILLTDLTLLQQGQLEVLHQEVAVQEPVAVDQLHQVVLLQDEEGINNQKHI